MSLAEEGGSRTDRFRRVEALYHEALSHPSNERAAFLAVACAGDSAVANEVQALLDQSDSAAGLLATPAMDVAALHVARDSPSLIGNRIGVFEVKALLGIGGMGEVYRARDTRLEREVAIKVLPAEFRHDPDRVVRFEREAHVLASLNHPNIGAVYGLEDAEDQKALVMELVEGQDLSERLAQGALPVAEALAIARQIAEALEAAHERGVIHRDLKPANIKVRPDGTVKVLDFGLAKALESPGIPAADPTQSPTLTARAARMGMILGTAAYMAPEQALGKEVDRRADVWSFGCVLYEILVGRRAFQGGDVGETLAAVLSEPPLFAALPAAVPPRIRRLIERCLDRDPRTRLRDIGEARIEITRVEGLIPDGADTTRHPPGTRWPRFLPAAVLVLSCAGLVSLGWVYLRAPKAVEPPPEWIPVTFNAGYVHTARFMRDGQSIVYSAAWDDRPVEVYATTATSPESRRLELPPAGLLSVSPTGELALSLGCRVLPASTACLGTLARAPFLGGAPRAVASNVLSADWAPDGELAAGFHDVGSPSAALPLQARYSVRDAEHLRFSRDGTRLAWTTGTAVFLRDSIGTRRVSSGWIFLDGLAWSADDRAILVSGVRRPDCIECVMRVAEGEPDRPVLRGAGRVRLLDAASDGSLLVDSGTTTLSVLAWKRSSGPPLSLAWFNGSVPEALSVDGRALLFTERGSSSIGRTDLYPIYVRSTDGGPPTRVGTGYGLDISPNGRWALTRTRPVIGPAELVLFPLGAGSPRTFQRGKITPGEVGWFADDQRIVFEASENEGPPRTYTQPTDWGPATLVAHEPGVISSPVAPDGNRFVSRRSDGSFWIARLDGSPSTRLPRQPTGGQMILQWTEDGRALFLGSRDAGYVTVERLDVERGTLTVERREASSQKGNVGLQTRVRISRDAKVLVAGGTERRSTTYVVVGAR